MGKQEVEGETLCVHVPLHNSEHSDLRIEEPQTEGPSCRAGLLHFSELESSPGKPYEVAGNRYQEIILGKAKVA